MHNNNISPLSHSALIVHSALACCFCTVSRLCTLAVSRCTLNSVHCTLDNVSLQSRLSVSRTVLSTLHVYSRLCTLDSLLSTLCFQSHVTIPRVPRRRQCDTVVPVVRHVHHSGTVEVGQRRSGTRCTDRLTYTDRRDNNKERANGQREW